MIIFLLVLILMFISTILVLAAGMLSSRLSKHERWVETYEESETVVPDAKTYPIK